MKIISNIQSNVNKQNSDNIFKNKQKNINVQTLPYSKSYSSPPLYNPNKVKKLTAIFLPFYFTK